MKLIITLCMVGLSTSTSFAEINRTSLKVENGKIVVAQSYCRMCSDTRTSCIIQCNGAGACIQRCYDAYQDCVEQNCRFR